ncbi:MAG TPA: 2'-5' RNA ligase family protein [Cyclobacteriaceae bacterium]
MKQNQQLYFIALLPPEVMMNEIIKLKNFVFEKYKSKQALKSPPHITLHMPFKWREDREDKLIDSIQEVSGSMYPFIISLNGFDFFKQRVVFIKVSLSEELKYLQKKIARMAAQHLKINNADYKNRPFHPHITIAFRDLKKENFQAARNYFEKQDFSRHFTAIDITLLKHNGKYWEAYFKAPLKSIK